MADYEDVYMQCPWCKREILKSAAPEEIVKWENFHIIERGCQE